MRYQGYCVDPATGEDARSRPRAEECETLLRRSIRRESSVNRSITRPGTFSLAQALRIHIESQTESTPLHVANLELYARELLGHFGVDRAIADIDQVAVDAYRAKAAKAKVLIWKGGPRKRVKMPPDEAAKYLVEGNKVRSPASTNHVLDCLRAAFAVANRIKDPVSGLPMLPHPPEVRPLPVPERLPRPMPDAELYARLKVARPWVRDAAELARYFGLRRAEALRVTVNHIDRERRGLRFAGTENKSRRDEWASPVAGGWELLLRLEAQAKRRGVRHLITWPGLDHLDTPEAKVPRKAWRPLKSIRRTWRNTALKAKIEAPHRLHDVRARFITSVATVNRGIAKEAARHADAETTEGYIGVSSGDVARIVGSVPGPRKRAARGGRR